MNEKELVLMAKDGNVKAFCILYDKYKKKLYNYAYYKLGNAEDAEDVVQDCVMTAFESINQLKKADSFQPWIFRILYCGCTVMIKEQMQKRNIDDIDDCRNISSIENEITIEREELKAALDILSEDEKNIVLLSVVAGLQSKEIAKISGYSAGNVRQKLSRSLTKMKRYLD